MTFLKQQPEFSYTFFMREPLCQLMKDYPHLMAKAEEATKHFEALRTGAAYSLDYADLDFKGHPFGSVLKMRCIMTLEGLQWCFKEVHNTIEGSGDYYELKYESKMKEIWFRKLCYFHRRTPFAEKLEAFRAKSGKTQNEPRYGFILQTD